MRHAAPAHGHPLRHEDPPPRPAWSTRGNHPTDPGVDSIPDVHLRADLEARGLGPTTIAALLHDRRTAGGRWRITQELAALR